MDCKTCDKRDYWTGCLQCDYLSKEHENEIVKSGMKNMKRLKKEGKARKQLKKEMEAMKELDESIDDIPFDCTYISG